MKDILFEKGPNTLWQGCIPSTSILQNIPIAALARVGVIPTLPTIGVFADLYERTQMLCTSRHSAYCWDSLLSNKTVKRADRQDATRNNAPGGIRSPYLAWGFSAHQQAIQLSFSVFWAELPMKKEKTMEISDVSDVAVIYRHSIILMQGATMMGWATD